MKTLLQTLTPYESYFVSWNDITALLEDQVKQLLGRAVTLHVWAEDYYYWGVEAKESKFTLAELYSLLDEVSATPEDCRDAIPTEGETETRSAGMGLGRRLLMRALEAEWQRESIEEDGLWLIGVTNDALNPYSRSGLLRQINQEKLMSMKDVLAMLKENGSTDRALSYIRERYMKDFGNELCWRYPISDGMHMGTFILVVEEGYLSIPYDSADEEDYEILIPEDAALHDVDSLTVFLQDWKSFADDLTNAMHEMCSIMEGGAHAEAVKAETP